MEQALHAALCSARELRHHDAARGYRDHAELLEIVQSGKVRSEQAHHARFRSDQILDAYEIFGQAARTRALRVLIELDVPAV